MFPRSRTLGRRPIALFAVTIAVGLVAFAPASPPQSGEELEGRAPTEAELEPAVQAAFQKQSYPALAPAVLVFFGAAADVTVQIFRTGPELARTVGNDNFQGVPVTDKAWVGTVRDGARYTVAVGEWPSGVYFARLADSEGRLGFAPFILRPRHLGEHRVAIVMPTLTWQAYNLRDDDGDGTSDTWYGDWAKRIARLARPFLNRGVPPHFRSYDLPFLHWLARSGHEPDFLADSDLATTDGRALDAAYDLIVFPGHHEYVTGREYDAVEQYRDAGGNLAFLSANNFFRRVDLDGKRMRLVGLWRDLGRPEAALIGTQYRGNDEGQHRGPWVLRRTPADSWLLAGTGLGPGSRLASGGIEIDRTAPSSPKSVQVLAEIPNLFGPGFTAQMTYYQTPAGARVFAAGAFTLAGAATQPVVSRLLVNIWAHLAQP